jgi:cell wall assembly regulator SMI1
MHSLIQSLRRIEALQLELEPGLNFAWNPPPRTELLAKLNALPGLPDGLKALFALHDGQRRNEGWGSIVGGFFFCGIEETLDCYEHQRHTATAYGPTLADSHRPTWIPIMIGDGQDLFCDATSDPRDAVFVIDKFGFVDKPIGFGIAHFLDRYAELCRKEKWRVSVTDLEPAKPPARTS